MLILTIISVTFPTSSIVLFIIAAITAIVGSFLLQGLRKIPTNPPHIAVVTIFGERTRKIKREGWRFFPIYPFWYGCIIINMTKKNVDLSPQTIRTRDLAEVEIFVSLTWTPNENYAIEYLNHNSENGINNILSDMVRERLRQWAMTDDGGKTWESLLRAREEATEMLIRDISGLPSNLSKADYDENIKRIRIGDGVQTIAQMGITLNRLNITEMKPKGELARTAERLVKEQQDIKGIDVVMDKVQEIMKKLNCSSTQAIEILQTERGVVPKKIKEIKVNVTDDVIKSILEILHNWKK